MPQDDAFETARGAGDETHQRVAAKPPKGAEHLTTNQGVRIADNQNQLKSGPRGPVLLEDFALREKIFHFDHERIPERIVHARGSAAHGYFETYESLKDITRADLFQRAGEKTPVFTRFSTVAGGAGSVDTPRDVRGFAVKFYTQEGNWDLVGNNIPVFFIQDAIKFPDLIHAAKMEADRGFPQAATAHDTFWDFISLTPESTHMMMWAMSDRTIPRSLRTMEGFGIHTFQLINAEGKVTLVKFHWKPKQGLASTLWDEAVKIAGADPDFQRRDLFEAIQRGDYPEWELGIQMFDEGFAEKFDFDVLDPTKIIPEEILPVKLIGRMVLDRWPDNFFAETEQVAYCPANVVPGIGFSNDPLLQGRLFSYLDTQKSRLGTANFHQLPVNQAKCPVMNFQRDGQMQMLRPAGRANYEPNSLAGAGEPGGPRECPATGYATAPASVGDEQPQKARLRPESFADHYSQARLFYRSQSASEQAHMVAAFAFELSKVALPHIRERMLANLGNVDDGLAQRVARALNTPLPKAAACAVPARDLPDSVALRIIDGPREKRDIKGGTVGVLISNGADAGLIHGLEKDAAAAGARVKLIAQRIGPITLSDGKHAVADSQLAGTPSVVVDAVAVLLSADGCEALLGDVAAVQFVTDAYAHLKVIGFSPEAQPLLDKAGVRRDAGVVPFGGGQFWNIAGQRQWSRESQVRPAY
jgi:catalase